MNKIIRFIFVFFCVLISCVLFGCKSETIKFYRESKVQDVIQNLKEQDNEKDVVKKSSGIIIYKDNSYHNSESSGIKFGPRDINFDLRTK